MVVREILPGGPVRAVVFANGAPGALAQIGPPALPVRLALLRFVKPLFFVFVINYPLSEPRKCSTSGSKSGKQVPVFLGCKIRNQETSWPALSKPEI